MTSVCFVVNELLGQNKSGGIGSTTTWRALVLASRGIDVTVLLAMAERPVDQHWLARYADAGVQLRWLEPETSELWPKTVTAGVRVYRTLLTGPVYDAIVFQDWLAFGWTSAAAKHAGIAFRDTTLVHSVHGPTEWVLDGNGEASPSPGHLAVALAERTSAELCDVVVTPSEALVDWMTEQGWQLADVRHVPRLTDRHLHPDDTPVTPVAGRDLEEIVFFGRFAENKGVRVLTRALGLLGPEALRRLRLTFLGRASTYDDKGINALLAPEVVDALAEVRFITNLDQPEAIAYLCEGGRLVVIPSTFENSPNVVSECIDHMIPMLVSTGPGVAEAVAPDDRARVSFAPTPEGLAERLAPFVRDRSLPAPVRRANTADPIAVWEALLADKPSRADRHRASGAVLARGDGIELHDDHGRVMSEVMAHTGADAVTCAVRSADGDRYYFGRGLAVALHMSLLGGPGTLWREDVIEELGGLHPDLGPWHRDAELLLRLAARGGHIVAVPEVLASIEGSEPEDPVYRVACQATLRGLVDPALRQWPRLVSGQRVETLWLRQRIEELEDELATTKAELEATQAHAGHFLGLAVNATKEAKKR